MSLPIKTEVLLIQCFCFSFQRPAPRKKLKKIADKMLTNESKYVNIQIAAKNEAFWKKKQIKKIPKKLLTKAMTCDILSKLPLMKKTAEHLDK